MPEISAGHQQPIKSNIAIDTLRQRAMISSLACKPTVVRALAHASRPRLIGVSTGEQQQGLFRFYVSRTPHVSKGLHGPRGTKHTAFDTPPNIAVARLSARYWIRRRKVA